LAGIVRGVRVIASWERDTRFGVVERSRRRAELRRAMTAVLSAGVSEKCGDLC
jgi:hypothetical protein